METESSLGHSAERVGDERDWLSAASYWHPPLYTTTAWLEHAPFAYWLMDAIRPSKVVELGTHYGYSYFVFCEAVARLGIQCRTFALDSWEGDDQAGIYGEDVFEFVSETNERNYGSFSTLLRGYFDESLDKIDDGSIDLLHIDGRHGYADARHDFEAWQVKLSKRGVVLFHDIAEHQEGFGVWQLWDELREEYPSFAFDHAHGLGVLAVGTDVPPALSRFFRVGKASGDAIKNRYEDLSKPLAARARLERLPAEVESLKEHWAASESARISAENTVKELHGKIAQVREETEQRVAEYRMSTSWRVTAPVRAIGGLLRKRG